MQLLPPKFPMPSNYVSRRRQNPEPSPTSLNSFRVEPWLKSMPSSKADLSRLIAVVSIAAAVAVACNFIANSINQHPKPFCDNNDYSLSDRCDPCPENGLCYDGKMECGHGYRKHGKVCVEDGDINETAKKISKWAEVRVCDAYAQFSCSGIRGYWVGQDELWNKLYEDQTRDKDKLDEAIYMSARKRANETICKLLETRRNSQGIVEFKCPESIVNYYKPLSCRARKWMVKHALLLVPICALFIGGILIASRVYRRRVLSARAEQVYHEMQSTSISTHFCRVISPPLSRFLDPNFISLESPQWSMSRRKCFTFFSMVDCPGAFTN
ncbi:uncharacterized protein LOC142552126 isoform X3 [Primulina tabacum]|uniref:uncharacterized protein LOC142552126 isoform X3 n=1 Tax=Primulina tabacum TaxID=48773 RepID=UPI003F59F919